MSNFNTLIHWEQCSDEQRRVLLMRPVMASSNNTSCIVHEILNDVQANGDQALRKYSKRFDQAEVNTLQVSNQQIAASSMRLCEEIKHAIAVAITNIETFHYMQQQPTIDIETQPGVRCQQVIRPIDSVGLYVPGGSAPLLSTVLMLAIPAHIAGCHRVILCSPPPVADEILYAAHLCGVQEIFQIGGAQAIAAMSFGTNSVPQVSKIFGPGNAFVTEAKRQVSQRVDGVAIDMPAGPSEVLIIADAGATPMFVACDLLSQAEHGADSQVLLLTPDTSVAQAVVDAVIHQLVGLPREAVIRKALAYSRFIVAQDLLQCVAISNQYGPEHLIIQTRNARNLMSDITNAGSIFLGDWSPESAGDYASGTNHVLPTYGYAVTRSGLGVVDFQKKITVQELTPHGLMNLATTIEILASAEQLIAHKNAVTLRVATLKEQI